MVDLLSSQTVAGGEPAVQSVACAAFGRGEIAEQEICWHDALRHFETAARLEDNKDHLAGLVRLLRLLGRTAPNTATCLNKLVALYRPQGRYDAAITALEAAVFISRAVLGPEHPITEKDIASVAGVKLAKLA